MSEALEILGAASLAFFAYLVWPPLLFLVLGAVLLVAGFALDGVKIRRPKK